MKRIQKLETASILRLTFTAFTLAFFVAALIAPAPEEEAPPEPAPVAQPADTPAPVVRHRRSDRRRSL